MLTVGSLLYRCSQIGEQNFAKLGASKLLHYDLKKIIVQISSAAVFGMLIALSLFAFVSVTIIDADTTVPKSAMMKSVLNMPDIESNEETTLLELEYTEAPEEIKLLTEYELLLDKYRGNIDRELLSVIIHTESRHKSTAISSMNAVGLMQITQPCLDDYQRVTGIKYTLNDVLYDIEKNLEVGCWYLNRVMTLYGPMTDEQLYCIYNAGYGNYQKYYWNYYRLGLQPNGKGYYAIRNFNQQKKIVPTLTFVLDTQ
jgi:soluble lytic murein transglycosylase-like protein